MTQRLSRHFIHLWGIAVIGDIAGNKRVFGESTIRKAIAELEQA